MALFGTEASLGSVSEQAAHASDLLTVPLLK